MEIKKMEETLGWSPKKKFVLTWTVFTLVAILIGAFWHAKWFDTQYQSFNFITAEEVIVPLALTSMLLFGFISTYFFHHIYPSNQGAFGAVKTSLMVVLIPRMVVTFAHAAEQDVNGNGLSFILFEFGLYSIIAVVWGVMTREIYKR